MPIGNLSSVFDPALTFAWADLTNSSGAGNLSGRNIMSLVTRGFDSAQMQSVKEFGSLEEIYETCPQNYMLRSLCFGALVFHSLPNSLNDTAPLNYTMLFDGGLGFIDVEHHTSDDEVHVIPLQWAVDTVSALPSDSLVQSDLNDI